ncbi:MAG: TonB-dependent receptor, partial [Sphingomonadaceae bacterium]|nr:TonB-dependent receptor [Sphingomonadaceae bacterium]
ERTALLRYGGPIGGNGHYRVYLNAYDRDNFARGAGLEVDDGGEGVRAGFRTDFGSGNDSLTLQGDIFTNDSKLSAANGEDGGNIRARWNRQLNASTTFQLQAYYDAFKRRFSLVSDELEIADVEAQFGWSGGRHQLVAGAGVRTTKDMFVNNLGFFTLDPVEKRLWLGNIFIQDRFAISDRLAITAGLKLEKTSFTSVEVLPNLRLAYQPNDKTLLWTAVSRAVRTPSRIDRDLQEPGILLAGTFNSEQLTALEVGYRGQPSAKTSVSVSLFYNMYDGLRTTEPASTTAFLPVRLENGLEGDTFGIEAWGTAEVASWWRLSAGIATIDKDFELKPGRVDIENGISLGNDADVQARFRSQMNLAANVEFDVMLRAVDTLPDPHVDSYMEADARIAWRPSEVVELFVAGRNLLHDRRDESGDAERGSLLPRSVIAGTRLTF